LSIQQENEKKKSLDWIVEYPAMVSQITGFRHKLCQLKMKHVSDVG